MKILKFTDLHRGFSSNTHLIHGKFFNNLKDKEFDIIITTGDFGCNKTKQTVACLKEIRKAFPEKPIYVVIGNHDLWDKERHISIGSKINTIKNACQQHNIHYLEGQPVITDKYIICGVNGWYKYSNDERGTNDYKNMQWITEGIETDEYLRNKAIEEFEKLIDIEVGDRAVIFATHMGVVDQRPTVYSGITAIGNYVMDWAHLCLSGHSHSGFWYKLGQCFFANSGGDYDRPAYMILNIDETSKEVTLLDWGGHLKGRA